MPDSPLSVALLGVGQAGKKHIQAISRHSSCRLVALADKDPFPLPDSSSSLPVFSSLESLLSEGPPFELLALATPNGLHAVQAIQAMRQGRHVLVEKPLALTSESAKAMLDAASANGVRLFCVLQNRFAPGARLLRELEQEGAFGKIALVSVTAYWNRGEDYYRGSDWKGSADMDGGPLLTQFSHLADLLLWVFGEAGRPVGFKANRLREGVSAVEDTGSYSFRFGSGAICSFNYTVGVRDRNYETGVTVIAERMTLRLGGQYLDELVYCDRPEITQRFDGLRADGLSSDHYHVYDSVVGSLFKRGKDCSAAESLRVVELLEEMTYPVLVS